MYCRWAPLLVDMGRLPNSRREQLDRAGRRQSHDWDQNEVDALITTEIATACCFCGGMSWRISEITSSVNNG
jgi:hypothetical protein